VISVKARNKYQFGKAGRLNSRYKLGSRCYEHVAEAQRKYKAKAAFLSISFEEHTFGAYFGLLSILKPSTGISTTTKGISRYLLLADHERHNFNFFSLKNTY